jgi:hypothetical protein
MPDCESVDAGSIPASGKITVTELASCTRFRLEVMWVRVPPVINVTNDFEESESIDPRHLTKFRLPLYRAAVVQW